MNACYFGQTLTVNHNPLLNKQENASVSFICLNILLESSFNMTMHTLFIILLYFLG